MTPWRPEALSRQRLVLNFLASQGAVKKTGNFGQVIQMRENTNNIWGNSYIKTIKISEKIRLGAGEFAKHGSFVLPVAAHKSVSDCLFPKPFVNVYPGLLKTLHTLAQ